MIGVLTKVDKVGRGDEEPWLDILRKKSHATKHGYYVTRLMETQQLQQKMTWLEGRVQEHKFFEKKAPWRFVNRDRLGVEKLSEALSKQLSLMIEEKCLPFNALLT